MDYGFINEQAYVGDIMWIDVADDEIYGQFWWQSYLEGIRFRDQVTSEVTYESSIEEAEAYSTVLDPILCIVDSGSSCLILPEYVYDFVLEKLKAMLTKYSYDYNGWGYIFECSEMRNLKTIDLLYGGVWLEVLVEDYVYNFDGQTCAFCLSSSGDPWTSTLGNVVMRNYYVIHDMDRMRLGFAVLANVNLQKVTPVHGKVPSCSYEEIVCVPVVEPYQCWDGSIAYDGEDCRVIHHYECDDGKLVLMQQDCFH